MQKAFISYVTENEKIVGELCEELKGRNIDIWIDKDDRRIGVPWKLQIHEAIRNGAFFIACFSKEFNGKKSTFMNDEIDIAIDCLRSRHYTTKDSWFIPVKLNECEIPKNYIRSFESIEGLNYAKLYEDWTGEIRKIIETISPKTVDAEKYFYLANNFREKGYYQQSIESYDDAIILKPDFPAAYYCRALAKFNIKKYDDALSDIKKLFDIKPDYYKALDLQDQIMLIRDYAISHKDCTAYGFLGHSLKEDCDIMQSH